MRVLLSARLAGVLNPHARKSGRYKAKAALLLLMRAIRQAAKTTGSRRRPPDALEGRIIQYKLETRSDYSKTRISSTQNTHPTEREKEAERANASMRRERQRRSTERAALTLNTSKLRPDARCSSTRRLESSETKHGFVRLPKNCQVGYSAYHRDPYTRPCE